MRSFLRRIAATIGAALLATVPLLSVVGAGPASAVVTDEVTASYTEPYPAFSTLTTSSQEFRQTFQASVTGELTRTRIWLRSEFANYPAGGIPASVSVYHLNADNTLGALVDTGSAVIGGAAWPAPTTDTATFSGGQTLTAGSKYALVVRSQITGWDSSFYAEMVGGSYPYGRAYVCGVGTESCSTNYWSTWFQVYVSTVPADTTPPVLSLTVAPDPVLQGLTATATFTATDAESDITTTTCAPSFAVDTSVAGIFTVNCGATSAGGTSETSYTYTVLTPSAGITNLQADVMNVELVPLTMQTPLNSLLEGAKKNLVKEDTAGALDKMDSFVSLVEAQDGKKLKTETADMLITEANTIIVSIEYIAKK